MMHHSLYRRDLLRTMNANPLILQRRDPHRNVGLRGKVEAGPGQLKLSGKWRVQTARKDRAEELVAEDARDFLKHLGVELSDSGESQILVEIGSCPVGFRTVVERNRVEVHAADAGSMWAGWVSLEHEMRRNGGAVLANGERSHKPAWQVQIAPPSWGANYAVPDFAEEFLSDQTLRSLAHQGVDGLLIYGDFLVYTQNTRFKELDHPDAQKHLDILKDATERAAPYGIKLYYCVVGPKLAADHAVFQRVPGARGAKLAWGKRELHCLCSSDDDALGFHAEAMTNLFTHAPQLGGLILIIGGESYYHCFMRAADAPIGETNCPRCKGKVAEDVIANLLKVTADAAQKINPKARVMAWPYSAQFFWAKEVTEGAMIDRLPANVGFLSEIDKDEIIQKEGYKRRIWDYTVEAQGASKRIQAQAKRCRDKKRSVYVKTETCHGIELLHLPYVPGITRSARMWAAMRSLAPEGVLQRWGFIGMFDSVAERMAFKARWDSEFDPDRASQEVAREVVGERGPKVVEAWRKFDESLGHIPVLTTGAYYIGPAFLGPAHPLPVWDGATPDAFKANLFYIAEEQSTFSKERVVAKDDLTLKTVAQLGAEPGVAIVEKEFTRAAELAGEGHAILQKLDPQQQVEPWRSELIEQREMGEYLYRTFRAASNTVKFLREREGAKSAARLREIAQDELLNAKAAAEMYQSTPWLSHALRLDVLCPDSLKMTQEKIRLLEKFVAK